MVSHLVHYDALLQNETKLYNKMGQLFYFKMRQLLKNATFITKCVGTLINRFFHEVTEFEVFLFFVFFSFFFFAGLAVII